MTVLVVDDEKMLREAILFEFEMEGITAHGAEDGQEALKMLAANEIDVVVSDVRMPKMSGVGLLEEVRKKSHSAPPMIFLTGFADIAPETAYAKGIDCILPKPFDSSSLRDAVDRVQISRAEYWSNPGNKQASESLPIQVERIVFGDHCDAQDVQIGRGGAFIPCEKFHAVGKRLHVSVQSQDASFSTLEFWGTVRWCRPKAKGVEAPGLGLEFEFVHIPSVDDFCQKIDESNPLAYIPLGAQFE